MKTKSPILERNGRWILQKTFDGKQKQIALDTTDEKVATTRANRFLACYEVNGFQTALDELRKKPVVKRGDDLTFQQMEQIYREYLAQADNPPRPETVKHSLGVLKRIMNGKPISKLNMVEVRGRLLIDQNNPSNRRSYASNCRHASAIFKPACLKFYKTKGITLLSPFAEMEFQNPTVQPYIPMSQETLEKVYNGSLTELPPTQALIVNSCLTMKCKNFGREFLQARLTRRVVSRSVR